MSRQTVDQELEEKSFSLKIFCLQILSSSLANIAGGAAGHPLDTIRVRVQAETTSTSSYQVMKETYRIEGLRAFYKGCLLPLFGTLPYNTMIFTCT